MECTLSNWSLRCLLEVVIKAESNVVSIKIQTILADLAARIVVLALLPAKETDVRNKRQVLIQVNSDAGTCTYRPSVDVVTSIIDMTITQTAVHKHVNVLRMHESIACVWVYFDGFCITPAAQSELKL